MSHHGISEWGCEWACEWACVIMTTIAMIQGDCELQRNDIIVTLENLSQSRLCTQRGPEGVRTLHLNAEEMCTCTSLNAANKKPAFRTKCRH